MMTKVPLWYDPFQPGTVVPDDLSPFMEGDHYISTKQVPSALLLSKAGSQTVSKNQALLLNRGFKIQEESWEGEEKFTRVISRTESGGHIPHSYSESLSAILKASSDMMDAVADNEAHIDDELEHSGSESSQIGDVLSENAVGPIRLRRTVVKRIKYEDPWKIHAASALANLLGRKGPKVTVWSGDGFRLSDPLPPRLLGAKWDGSSKNKIRFFKIADDKVRLGLIYRHTHWGRRLRELCSDRVGEFYHWAQTLKARINGFLKGKPDPIWTADEKQAIAPDGWVTRSRSSRALRLIEVLKTVDGIFTQRYLVNPAEVWTWERFDMFTLGNLSLLLGDEFLDGELPLGLHTIRTSYSELKAARKWFKLTSHKGELETAPLPTEVGPWARQFWMTWKAISAAKRHKYLMCIGILSQTRGCGTPPPLVVLQSKRKFLECVALEPSPEEPTYRSLREMALLEVIQNIPEVAVTGLATKSRVTVTSSACWEKTRAEGGTTEAIKELICAVGTMCQVPVRDLDTGKVESWVFPNEFDSVGELIFWVSLDRVLRTPPDLLKAAFLTVVKEPGKARSVTKARACLKIVLDLVSKICSEPLAKGIRSSQSGMTASNHGWNFFNSLTSGEEREETFKLLSREETPFEGYAERRDVFEDLYVSSTDYKEATDKLEHHVAAGLGRAWMTKCGIPALLQGIVMETCYKPRKIYFKATGLIADLGNPAPELGSDIHWITLRRGVLMGDPLTKPVLHLVNACNRHLQNRILDADFYSRLGNFNEISQTLLDIKESLLSK